MTEEDVKKAIRSLLTSTPNVLNVRTVQKDYKELMGTDVPYQQFGYNSLEQFLKCIPDVCLVQGGGQWATVIPIVNEKVAHINNMVMKQRNNSRKSAGTRRPKQANFQHKQPMNFSPHTTDSSKGSNLIFHNTQANPYQAPPSKQVDNPHSEVPQKSVKNTPPLISKNPFDNSQLPVETRVDGGSIAEVKADVRHSLLNGLPTKRKQHLLNLNPLPKQAETVHNQYRSSTSAAHSPPFDNAPVLENENDYFFTSKNLDIFKPYLNSAAKLQEATEEVAVCVPQRVQNNLKTLISRFNEGIWCSQLPEEYRKAFRRDLVYYDYGFTSLIEMCIALNDIFHYVRPGQDDFKLYDRNNPLPDNIERNFTMASYQLDPKGGAQTSGKPLPSLVWSDFARRLPADIVSLGEEIPKQFLPTETKVGDVFDVVVLEVYDPSKFWFYLGKSDKKAPLDLLMDDMQEFYKGENISQYCVPPALVQEGLYCVQRILGEYHRAKIVRVPPHAQDQVRLLYIDYGTVASESVTGMCFLHRRFANLPAQAIRCRLANVKPVNVGPWPRPVSDYVRDVLNGSNTKLKVTFIDWHDEYVCGFLADVTNTDRIVYVNELLVRKGHAKWETEAQESPFMLPNYKCKVNRLHLFPSFLELEYGLAPNASEMYMLEEMLVPINFCIPQYFELVDTLDDDEAIEARENSFADTIKTHRKTLPYGCKESRAALGCPDFDFDVFDELKEDIVAFIEGLSSEERSKFRNVECCNEWYECVEEAVVDEAAGEIVRQDVDLSENILKQLETYELPADLVFDEQKVSYMADPVAVRQTEIDDLERELSMLLDDDFVERRKDDEEKVPGSSISLIAYLVAFIWTPRITYPR
ncbi:tudor domain-containing protein 7 isoform X2 [Cylas formicarius]|uniref:tudor domain-containing protein 7 isoform X2 n=1 Tax=Cylas formicarius TaxID=197179 RepID=UPI0029583D86|nr:tudor domain-containing protein 7 isoform X2 [Cylas formicarius]